MFARFTNGCGRRRKGYRHYDSYVNDCVNKSIEKELIAKLLENYGRNRCVSVLLMLVELSLIDAGCEGGLRSSCPDVSSRQNTGRLPFF
jgi:hypothetical protein